MNNNPNNIPNSQNHKQKSGAYSEFMEKMHKLPYWFFEVFWYELNKQMSAPKDQNSTERTRIPYTLQTFDLTFAGKKELQTRSTRLPVELYKLLHLLSGGYNLAEISVNNFWSLEKTSKLLSICCQREYIIKTTNSTVQADSAYIGGELKLGEYLKRLGIISTDQIEEALFWQKKYNDSGDSKHIGEIFTSMGVVGFDEIRQLIALRDSAKEAAVLNFGGNSEALSQEMLKMKKIIAKLSKENKMLKQQQQQ